MARSAVIPGLVAKESIELTLPYTGASNVFITGLVSEKGIILPVLVREISLRSEKEIIISGIQLVPCKVSDAYIIVTG